MGEETPGGKRVGREATGRGFNEAVAEGRWLGEAAPDSKGFGEVEREGNVKVGDKVLDKAVSEGWGPDETAVGGRGLRGPASENGGV